MTGSNYGFQRGDVIFSQNGRTYYLRLTLGALAEICARLEQSAPLALAESLKTADIHVLSVLLRALARPAHGEIKIEEFNAAQALTAIAEIFERAFSQDGSP